MKITKTQEEIFRSNEYFFYRKIKKDKQFKIDLLSLVDKNCKTEELKKTASEQILITPWDWERPFTYINKALEVHVKSIKSLRSKELAELDKQIKEFLSKYHFGEEWHFYVQLLLLTGTIFFPYKSFVMEDNCLNHPDKIVILMDSNTSIKELKEEFPKLIKIAKQKEVPFNRKKISSKKFGQLQNYLDFIEIVKMMEADRQNEEKLGYYESFIYRDELKKNKTLKEIERTIYKKHRKGKALTTGTGKIKGRAEMPHLREQITDAEYIKDFLNIKDKKDLKRAINKLRTARKRL